MLYSSMINVSSAQPPDHFISDSIYSQNDYMAILAAYYSGNHEILKALLGKEKNINKVDIKGRAPFMYISNKTSLESLNY